MRRKAPKRLQITEKDRRILGWICRLQPAALIAIIIVKPETVVRWHRSGFRKYWAWKSRKRAGRPKSDRELRNLIRQMCEENPLWGAPRIHGEMLMLGFDISQSTVSKYMFRRRGPPSMTWRAFLRHQADGIAAIDLFAVPTVGLTFCTAWLSWLTEIEGYCMSQQRGIRLPDGSRVKL